MSSYITKKGVTGAIYTINRNEKTALVAFRDGKQAGTYRRLINEMYKLENSQQIRVERVKLNNLVSICNNFGLDVIQLDSQHDDRIYSTDTMNMIDMRIALDNNFLYDY